MKPVPCKTSVKADASKRQSCDERFQQQIRFLPVNEMEKRQPEVRI
jgi:hypothetical protein